MAQHGERSRVRDRMATSDAYCSMAPPSREPRTRACSVCTAHTWGGTGGGGESNNRLEAR